MLCVFHDNYQIKKKKNHTNKPKHRAKQIRWAVMVIDVPADPRMGDQSSADKNLGQFNPDCCLQLKRRQWQLASWWGQLSSHATLLCLDCWHSIPAPELSPWAVSLPLSWGGAFTYLLCWASCFLCLTFSVSCFLVYFLFWWGHAWEVNFLGSCIPENIFILPSDTKIVWLSMAF